MATRKKAKKGEGVWAMERRTAVCPDCGALLLRPEKPALGAVEVTCGGCGAVCQAVFMVQQGA